MGNFVDHVKITCKAGNGGNGSMSFHREKFVLNGGPDGGDGGNGGNVCFYADLNMHTLLDFRFKSKYTAENGVDGAAGNCTGKRGEDLIIKVPVGTVIREAESGAVVADMDTAGETRTILHGGRGGWGNRHFATPTRQVPMFAKNGSRGEEREVVLELKMLADVGLIGYPSVGKSSLLSRISAARPKVADYHFTTLSPMLGVVPAPAGEGAGFVAADIPGLIEGAAEGAGLGHAFLRHVDRCRLLLHVVDIVATEYRDPVEDIKIINGELERYSPELAGRPQIIVANKIDALDRERVDIPAFEQYVASLGCPLVYISAVTGEGVDELIRLTVRELAKLPPIKVYEREYEPEDAYVGGGRETTIRRENDTFYVEGEWLFNLMGQINFSDYESLNFFQKVLRRSGVFDELEARGCTDGCTVSIYDFEFEYVK